jgi:hypothetical protein
LVLYILLENFESHTTCGCSETAIKNMVAGRKRGRGQV